MNRRTLIGSSGVVSAFAGVTFFLALIQCFCLGCGCLGLRMGRPGAVFGLSTIILLSVLLALRFRHQAPDGDNAPAPKAGSRLVLRIAWGVAGLTLAGAAALWARLWHLAWLRPCYDWDGLYYHLPAISGWASRGRVAWLDGGSDVPFVNYPMGVEVTTFFMHLVFGTSRLATACNLWYWPLAFLAVVAIARLLDVRGPWRWISGAWIAGASGLVCQSVTCYTDPGFTAAAMGALAASGLLVFGRGIPVGWRIILWGASLGLLAGAKGTGAPFAAVLAFCVAVVMLVQGRDQWQRWVLRLGLAASITLAVGGYWYIRSTLVTGNPIHPIELKFGEKVLFPGYDRVVFVEANLPAWLAAYPRFLRVPVPWLQLDAPIQGYDPVGGMGYVWLFGCLPAMLLLFVLLPRRRSDPVVRTFLFFGALAITLLMSQTSPWWSRFTVWLLALGLPSLAWVLQHAATAGKRWLWPVALLFLAAASGLALWESNRTLGIEAQVGKILPAPASGPAYASSADRLFPRLAQTPGIDRFLEARKIARSPWGRLGTLFGGVLAQPLGAREIMLLPTTPTAQDLRRMAAEGVTWVIWDVVGAGPPPDLLREAAVEEVVFHPAPDVDFRFFCLRTGPA